MTRDEDFEFIQAIVTEWNRGMLIRVDRKKLSKAAGLLMDAVEPRK